MTQARARGAIVQPASTIARTSAGNTGTPTVQSPAGSGGVAGTQATLTLGTSSIASTSPSGARRTGPAVIPAPTAQPLQTAAATAPQQQPPTSQPNLMQKFTEMTAPGGDILSKGKELIFMKFGLGGK